MPISDKGPHRRTTFIVCKMCSTEVHLPSDTLAVTMNCPECGERIRGATQPYIEPPSVVSYKPGTQIT